MHCPLADACPGRQSGNTCTDVNRDQLSLLIASDDQCHLDACDCPRLCGGGVLPFVQKLAEEHLRRGNATRMPVSTDLICLADEGHPIEVRTLDLKACQAAIWRVDDGWVIQIAETATPPRHRVSLFHEAFHIMAHTRSDSTPLFSKRGTTQGSFNELLADYFAICVLMPRPWVRKEWVKLGDLDRMAQTFDVPGSTMCLSLKELGLAH